VTTATALVTLLLRTTVQDEPRIGQPGAQPSERKRRDGDAIGQSRNIALLVFESDGDVGHRGGPGRKMGPAMMATGPGSLACPGYWTPGGSVAAGKTTHERNMSPPTPRKEPRRGCRRCCMVEGTDRSHPTYGRRAVQDNGRRRLSRALSRRGTRACDLIAGQVQVSFGSLPSSVGYIRTGKLRAFAVTIATREHLYHIAASANHNGLPITNAHVAMVMDSISS